MTPLNRKPPLAAWMVRERKRLGLKPKDIVDRLAAMNLEVSEATVKVWESNANRRPSPYNLEGLETIFGSQAPTETVGVVTDPAVSALVAAISELVEELRLSRAAQATIAEEQMHALAALAGGRALPGTPDGDGHAEPAGTGR